MSFAPRVALYCAVILVGALLGAAVPLRAQHPSLRVTLLAFAAGVMFGAAFFHMLPEAVLTGGYGALSWVPVGFVLLFLLERFVIVHACEEPPDCVDHVHAGGSLGMTAFFGLSAHTLFDGVALASAAQEGVGLTALIAIAAHKIPNSLSLASILHAEGRRAKTVMAYATAFGLMVPIGAALYLGLGTVLPLDRIAPKALALSSGTFLYIAVSDLLPHIKRHGHDGRVKHIAGMALGLLVMLALSWVHAPGA
jgi:zinc and cadmium transporter